jgi:hypothetical protein
MCAYVHFESLLCTAYHVWASLPWMPGRCIAGECNPPLAIDVVMLLQIASDALKGRVFEVSLADLQKVSCAWFRVS